MISLPVPTTPHVLITGNGSERTSRVTTSRIRNAVRDIETNVCVTLERCTPLVLVQQAECFAISFYDDSRIAAFFRVGRCVLRMVKSRFSSDEAAKVMCTFFRSSALPDMTDWTCENLHYESEEDGANLCVDGQDFSYFDPADVVAALDNIIEGKSEWMLYDFTGGNGGYLNIMRAVECSTDRTVYKVEYVRWTSPEPAGYMAVLSDAAALRTWVCGLVNAGKFCDPMPGWETFDVNDYFRRLTFKYLDYNKNTDNNER